MNFIFVKPEEDKVDFKFSATLLIAEMPSRFSNMAFKKL